MSYVEVGAGRMLATAARELLKSAHVQSTTSTSGWRPDTTSLSLLWMGSFTAATCKSTPAACAPPFLCAYAVPMPVCSFMCMYLCACV